MRASLVILLSLVSLTAICQLSPEEQGRIDTLQTVIQHASNDTDVVAAYVEWDNMIYFFDPTLDEEINLKIEQLCKSHLDQKPSASEFKFYRYSLGNASNNLGLIYEAKGEFDRALNYYTASLEIRKSLEDSVSIAGSYLNIGNVYADNGYMKKAVSYYNKALQIQESLGDRKGMATTLNNIGLIHQNKGEFDLAIEYFERSMKLEKEVGNTYGYAASYGNIAVIYQERGDLNKALEMFYGSLKIYESLNNLEGLAQATGNIGIIYQSQGEPNLALEYFEKSLGYFKEANNPVGLASAYLNLANVHFQKGDTVKAKELVLESLEQEKLLDDPKGLVNSLNGVTKFYMDCDQPEEALPYGLEALELSAFLESEKGISESHLNLGQIYFSLSQLDEAMIHAKKAAESSKKIGILYLYTEGAELLYRIYRKLGKAREALIYFEEFIAARDSLNNDENQKGLIRQQYQYDYEKKATADSIKTAEASRIKDAQLAAEQAENKRQKQQSYYLYIGLGLALLFGGFIYNRFKLTQKQKVIIEDQKQQVDQAFDELEEKNQEILDSINYAKRIQSAILPPTKLVKEYLKDSFILYKPKDIVAGDFYWMEHKDNKVLFAAADCTGHGVPGAMVSVVCNNGLNRAVREYGLRDPGKILDKTREIVIREFEKSEEEVKDGMDIALCSLSSEGLQPLDNNGSVTLHYAGAHNPLWIIRKGSDEIEEIRADKQPIGKFGEEKPFTTHEVELHTGDTFYIFSDGYADQFGGEKGKKFKAANFKKLLLSVQDESMANQKNRIDEAFEKWRGNLEQLDDICVIGLRI